VADRRRAGAIPAGPEVERLIQLLARLPGLGPRSARRAALHLIARPDQLMGPLSAALDEVTRRVTTCSICSNIDTVDPCAICRDPHRDAGLVCVVAQVGDLWALERTGSYGGRYHVLGGLLSALDGIGPDELSIAKLVERTSSGTVHEVILALSATVEGQTTAHYVIDRLREDDDPAPVESERPNSKRIAVTQLAHGVPVGGELDYLDDGTLIAALGARRGV
jgi:recombination protein RecR